MAELYILSILILFSAYLYKEPFISEYLNKETKTAILDNKNLFTSNSDKQVTKFLNDTGDSFNIVFEHIKLKNHLLYLNLEGPLKNNLNFIHNLNRHMRLIELSIQNSKGKTQISAKYDKSRFFTPKQRFTRIENIPAFFNKSTSIQETAVEKLVLYAVVLDNVNINGRWYKEDDIVNNKKISKVGINGVELLDQKQNKTTKLYIYKGEY